MEIEIFLNKFFLKSKITWSAKSLAHTGTPSSGSSWTNLSSGNLKPTDTAPDRGRACCTRVWRTQIAPTFLHQPLLCRCSAFWIHFQCQDWWCGVLKKLGSVFGDVVLIQAVLQNVVVVCSYWNQLNYSTPLNNHSSYMCCLKASNWPNFA